MRYDRFVVIKKPLKLSMANRRHASLRRVMFCKEYASIGGYIGTLINEQAVPGLFA